MGFYSRIKAYSTRAWIVAIFLAAAFLFGGGEAKSPAAELLVQILFAVATLCWIWMSGVGSPRSPDQRISLLIPVAILAVPAIQLVPLPPAIWHSLPGREPLVAALGIVGAADTWRPISAVPLRTLATLLAMIPPLGVFYAVSRLDLRERTLVPKTVLVMALLTAALGGLQVLASDGSLTFYQKLHAGWVTGFQSNRNHAADVILAGLVALPFVAKRSLDLKGKRSVGAGISGNLRTVAIGLALVLATALAMTGSRAGTSLGIVAGFAAMAIVFFPSREEDKFPTRAFAVASTLLVMAALGGAVMLSQEGTGISRIAARFADLRSERSMVWADAAFAWRQYWPVGIGAGGFVPAMFPAESLEYLNASYPNQAHNDYLEIGIEAGIGGYLILLSVIVLAATLAARNWFKDPRPEARLQVAFAASVLILLSAHSVVDYPLRSMSLACLAGAAGGMLARAGRRDEDAQRRSARID